MKFTTILKNSSIVIVLALGTKIFAFIREIIITRAFGASEITDCYYLALSVPQMLLIFFGIDAVKGVSTTLMTSAKNSGTESASKEFSATFWSLLITSILVSMISLGILHPMLKLLAPGFASEQIHRTSHLVKILLFLVIGFSFFRYFNTVLGVYHRFFWQNIFELLINLSVIFVLLFSKSLRLSYIALALVCAYYISLIFQYFLIKRNDINITFISLQDLFSQMKRLFFLVVPLLFVTNAQVLAKAVDKAIASTFEGGVLTSIGLATMVANMFSVLIIIPVLKVYYPLFSDCAHKKNITELSYRFYSAYSLLMVIILPLLIFALFFGKDIIAALFYRGKFDAYDLAITSQCFLIYILTIVPAVLYQVPTYIALSFQKNKILGIIGSISFIINIICSIILSKLIGYIGIPWGTFIGSSFYGIALNIFIINKYNFSLSKQYAFFYIFYTIASFCFVLCPLMIGYYHDNYMIKLSVNLSMLLPVYCLMLYFGYNTLRKIERNVRITLE